MITGHKLINLSIHTLYRFPQKQSSTVWVSKGCQESHSNTEGIHSLSWRLQNSQHTTCQPQPVYWPKESYPPRCSHQGLSVDSVCLISQSLSHRDSWHTVESTASGHWQCKWSSFMCEATVTPPPESLLTAWSNCDSHSCLAPQVTLLPAGMIPAHERSWQSSPTEALLPPSVLCPI